MDKSFHQEHSFVLVDNNCDMDDEKHIEELENKIKKLEEQYDKLEKRHSSLLKLMNELLKIKSTDNDLDNLDEIRMKITQILYNEVRRHTSFPFSTILGGGYNNYFGLIKVKSEQDLNIKLD